MSKGKKWSLTALPPKTGCRACGKAGWAFCLDCAAKIEEPWLAMKGCQKCGRRELATKVEENWGMCWECRDAAHPPRQRTQEEELAWSIAMSADMDRDNARQISVLFKRAS